MIFDAKTFIISDLHFGHEKMYTVFGVRPENFNELIIERWNKTVGENDTVLFLGDLAIESADATIKHCAQLKGKKYMILGNHDHRSPTWYDKCGFTVIDPIYKRFVNSAGEFKTLITHEPVANLPDGWYNIHGHIHLGMHREYELTDRHYNVSCEVVDYTPIQIFTILNSWKILV
jgi:calcineurin-like phosphoesterase family protein